MEKKLFIYIIMALLITMSWSCDEEDNIDPEGNWELLDPTVNTALVNTDIILDETTPNAAISFSWEPASSTAGYQVFYSVVIDADDSDNFDSPIIEVTAGNGGKNLSLDISYSELDEALSIAGYPANSKNTLSWAVIAKSLSKTSYDAESFTITRFASEIIPNQLFLSGAASENGDDVTQAIPLRRLNNSSGSPSNKYELYTHLSENSSFKLYSQQQERSHKYGGSEGNLEKSGNAISVDEEGEYRISVDLDNNTYSLLKIDKWSVVGSPINGGWGGDEPLSYQGAGIWSASIDLTGTGGFLFRANGDWSYLLKRVVGTTNTVIMESQAGDQGLQFEDIPSDKTGTFIFTLDLSAGAYTYSIDPDPDAAGPITAPETLYLFADGILLTELLKEGDSFSMNNYLALQSGVNYTLNSAVDGSGTAYSIDANVGFTDVPGGDKVSGTSKVRETDGVISVETDQKYQIIIDFSTSQLIWSYYNIKLFHWSDWDARDEFPMTYEDPNTYTITTDLKAGFDMKFISPWDIEMGAEDPGALNGNLINKGGSNIVNITEDGTYKVTIVISDDLQSGTYEFVKQ